MAMVVDDDDDDVGDDNENDGDDGYVPHVGTVTVAKVFLFLKLHE